MEIINFTGYYYTIDKLLNKLSFEKRIKNNDKVIIKPNLLEDVPPPCTTDVRCVEAVVSYLLERKSNLKISVLEGSGGCDTWKAFNVLGYNQVAKKYDIKLIDVDECRLVKLKNQDALAYKEIYLPEEVFSSFFISMPTLKVHSMTTVTLGLKNLIGLLPKKYYGRYLSYNRSDVHRVGVNKAIYDLNNYVSIDMTIIDGRVGQQGSHTRWGKRCNPPKNVIIGGYDALEVDIQGARILGYDWERIKHLKVLSKREIFKEGN